MALGTKTREKLNKIGYYPTKIEEDVIRVVSDFIRDTESMQTWITPNVNYNMRELIKKCYRHFYGVFEDKSTDHLGQEKIWHQLTQSFVESEVKNTDIDPKDVTTEADVPSQLGSAFILRPLIRRWMRLVNFGQDIDDDLRYRAIFGHVIRKVYNKIDPEIKKNMIHTRQVDLLRWYIQGNADSLHTSACAEMAIMSKADVKKNYKSWINLKFLKGKDSVRQYSDGNTTDVKSPEPLSEIYEYHAEIPEWWIHGDYEKWEKDGEPYKLGMVTVSNIFDCPVVHKILFNIKGRKPFEESRLIKVPNRYLGMGRAEQLFGYQLYLNILYNTRRVNQLLASNQLFTFRKGAGITPQMLSQIMTGGAIPRNDPTDIVRLDTQNYSFGESINEEKALIDSAQRLTDQNDIALGGGVPTNTPATLGVLQERSQGRGSELKKESFGRYLEQLFNHHIVPFLWKTIKGDDVLGISDDPANIRKMDENIINFYVNKALIEAFDRGEVIFPQQVDIEKQRQLQQFASLGKQRWIKLRDEYLDTANISVKVNVANEHIDKDNRIKLLENFVFNVSQRFPEYDYSDALRALIDMFELPIELKQKTQMMQMQGVMMGQQGSMMQHQMPDGSTMPGATHPQGQPQQPDSGVLQRANSLAQ